LVESVSAAFEPFLKILAQNFHANIAVIRREHP
jgi:hypothetical protein